MSDRYKALTVILSADTRDDDAETIISAITCLRGVASVTGEVANLSDAVAKSRVLREVEGALFKALREATK